MVMFHSYANLLEGTWLVISPNKLLQFPLNRAGNPNIPAYSTALSTSYLEACQHSSDSPPWYTPSHRGSKMEPDPALRGGFRGSAVDSGVV